MFNQAKPQHGIEARIRLRASCSILIAVIATAGAAACSIGESGPTEPLLPACDIAGPTFDLAPFDIDAIDVFEPLGAVTPPLHVLPGDYVTGRLRQEGEPPSPRGSDVRAPGDVRVSLIVRRTRYDDFDQPAGEDYSVTLDACRDVRLNIARMSDLSPILLAEAATWDRCVDNGRRNEPGLQVHFTFCVIEPAVEVERGTVLGSAGGQAGQGVLEMRAWDARNRPHAFANPFRYGVSADGFDVFHVNCPFEYFTQPLQQAMLAKLQRTTEPRCGDVVQDLFGTARGSWFLSEAGPGSTSVEEQLSLVEWSVDPSRVAIASGGALTGEPLLIVLLPSAEGRANRRPADITSDGNTYCYDAAGGRLLVKLETEAHLLAEFETGAACGGGPWTVQGAQIYVR